MRHLLVHALLHRTSDFYSIYKKSQQEQEQQQQQEQEQQQQQLLNF